MASIKATTIHLLPSKWKMAEAAEYLIIISLWTRMDTHACLVRFYTQYEHFNAFNYCCNYWISYDRWTRNVTIESIEAETRCARCDAYSERAVLETGTKRAFVSRLPIYRMFCKYGTPSNYDTRPFLRHQSV